MCGRSLGDWEVTANVYRLSFEDGESVLNCGDGCTTLPNTENRRIVYFKMGELYNM